MSFPTRIVLLLAGITCFAFTAPAQQGPPPADEPAAPQSSQNPPTQATPETSKPQPPATSAPQQQSDKPADKSKKDDAANQNTGGKVAGTSNDRLFYALPNFLSLENAKNLPPLTTGQKFKVVALGDFDPIQFPWWGLLSAVSQAENSEPGYKQGWAAFGKRYATTAADSTIENFMVGAVFPSILHQDPRFYELGHGKFIHRTGYAISRIFVTRTDSGHPQCNYSEIFGSALSAAISTYSYHPTGTYISTPTNPHLFITSDRTLLNTTSVWGTQVGLDTITLVIKEFWPDVHRMIKKRHNQAVAIQPGGANP